ncbi:hypothetical protein ENUP19_0266G0006 [Entamoeba nuttalli]|uniref:Importin alpha, putative n=2 Tax=Entamoeba nuttalli TaxID=412467 RepID=K2HVJ7_ENTNP|nr:importin alpha, putative [Entamoeba nuttalli P19]EKE40270.1 importin alpha, putative [Entamoeba nuttalli P19]|eukprot:XP_008857391.1 importin alpha, putative [Entamoeba nuttalli P19]
MSNLRADFMNQTVREKQQILSQLRQSRREACLAKRRTSFSEESEEEIIQGGQRKFIYMPRTLEEEEITPTAIRKPIDELNNFIKRLREAKDDQELFNVLSEIQTFVQNGANSQSILIKLSGLLNELISQILNPEPQIAILTLEILNSLATASSQNVDDLIDEQIINISAQGLCSNDVRVQRMIIHLLANIAGDSAKTRDLLLANAIVRVILQMAQFYKHSIPMQIDLMFLISNLCRNEPFVDFESIRPLVPIIQSNINSIANSVCVDAMYSISFLAQNPENSDFIIQNGLCDAALQIVDSSKHECLPPSLETINCLIQHGDKYSTYIFNKGFILKVKHLLKSNFTDSTVIHIVFVLSNLANTPNQSIIKSIINDVLFSIVTLYLESTSFNLKTAVSWLFVNIILYSEDDNIGNLLTSSDFFETYVSMYDANDEQLLLLLLKTTLKLCNFDYRTNRTLNVVDQLLENDIDSQISALISLSNISEEVVKYANLVQGAIRSADAFDA